MASPHSKRNTMTTLCGLIASAGLLLPACAGGGGEDEGPDGKADGFADEEALESPCDEVLADRSGRGFIPADVANDPFVQNVYMEGDGCPVTLQEIIAKLEITDAENCEDDEFIAKGGMATRVVSEQAQVMQSSEEATYRLVTTRQCGDRAASDLVFSTFGLHGIDPSDDNHISGSSVPDGLEVMSLDSSRGVFNFYKEIDGKMHFFGNSVDYVTRGAEGPGVTAVRGCANCHPGGSMVMKELASPWMHWEGDFETPGASEIFENRPYLGAQVDGIELESTVRESHFAVVEATVEALRQQGDTKPMLQPLFCGREVQIDSATSFFDPSSTDVLGGFASLGSLAMDPQVGFMNLEVGASEYEALISATGRTIPGLRDVADTVSALAHISPSGIDQTFIDHLVADGIIDRRFVTDVRLVDFTRPVFSDERCELLEFAPFVAPDEQTPETIRQGFIDNIKQAGASNPAQQQFLASLEAAQRGDADLSAFIGGAFESACEDRQASVKIDAGGTEVGVVLADAIKLASLQRKVAYEADGVLDELRGAGNRPFAVFEFEASMATDDIQPVDGADPMDLMSIDPNARLDPNTCELRNDFAPVSQPDIEIFGECTSEFGGTGLCIDTAVVECPSFTESGLCPGGATVLCCVVGFDEEFGD